MTLEQQLEQYIQTLSKQEKKNNTHPNKISRVLPLHIDATDPLYIDTLKPISHAVTRLHNYANYRTRNIYTGLRKKPHERYPKETESIEWANAALTRYKNNRINTITNKIEKLKADTTEDHEEELEEQRKLLHKIKKMNSLVNAEHSYLGYNMMDCIMQYWNEECYRALPNAIAQEVLREVNQNWQSFFAAKKSYEQNPNLFTGRPKLPGKRETGSMSTFTLSQRAWNLLVDNKTGRDCITIASSNARIDVGEIFHDKKELYDDFKRRTIDCVPVQGGFDLMIGYSYTAGNLVAFNDRVAGADLGVGNLITLVSNAGDTHPLIVDGRELKSRNRYFNMRNAKISAGYKGCSTSREKKMLWQKRHAQVDNLLGQAANKVCDWLVANQICCLVIGYNRGWKADGGLDTWDKATKQSFVHIPHALLISKLRDKCAEVGIRCVTTEESYTSKASLVDGDRLPTYGVVPEVLPDGCYSGVKNKSLHYSFSGSRVSRGLYRSRETFLPKDKERRGLVLSADVNGAGNICRKVFPSAFEGVDDWRFLLSPERVRLGVGPDGAYRRASSASE